jgi:protein disulfide-isomerase
MNIKLISKVLSISFVILFSSWLPCVKAQTQENLNPAVNAQPLPGYSAENPGWLVNIEEAYAVSKKTGKPIMANFTGSDWCGWCKRLTANVFSHDAFKQWAEKNVVLLELDFPRRKEIPQNIREQNSSLQQAFQVGGFPTVWVFNLVKDETKNQYTIEALGRTGYSDTVEQFTSGVEQMFKRK